MRLPVAMQATIVVPCYNEAERLNSSAFGGFVEEHRDIRFLFVNDGSTDSTSLLLQKLSRTYPSSISVLELDKNCGKAEAVRRGMLAAMASGADCAGYWDADLATPLEEIPQFREILIHQPGAMLVMGSRVCLLGRTIKRRSTRHLLGRGFASAASMTLRLSVYDTQCGAKLFRVVPAMRQIFQQPFGSRWIFDVEMLARIVSLSHRGVLPPAANIVYEQPLRRWEDIHGSKLKTFDFLLAVKELWSIHRKYRVRGVLRSAEKSVMTPDVALDGNLAMRKAA